MLATLSHAWKATILCPRGKEDATHPTLADSLVRTDVESSSLEVRRSNGDVYEGADQRKLFGDQRHMEICKEVNVGSFRDGPGRKGHGTEGLSQVGLSTLWEGYLLP